MSKIIVSIIFLFFICSFSFAETIYLKTGQKIEGKIIEKTDKYIKIDFQGIPLVYYFEDIDKIGEEPMKHWDAKKGLIIAIEPSKVEEREGVKIISYEPRGSDLKLVLFNSKDSPITIKYPSNWYAREKFSTDRHDYNLFLSRESIKLPSDRFLVGITIYYFKDYFLNDNWDSLNSRISNEQEKRGRKLSDIKDKQIFGYPAVLRKFKDQSITVMNQLIKINNDVFICILESPNEDYQSYENIFEEILDSIQIKS